MNATTTVNVIFWEPPGSTPARADYNSLILRYFQDVGTSSYYQIASQYTENSFPVGPHPRNAVLGTSFVDTHPYPENPLKNSDIQQEVESAISAHGWTVDIHHIVFVYTGPGENFCDTFGSAATACNTDQACPTIGSSFCFALCGYHIDDTNPHSSQFLDALYAYIPYMPVCPLPSISPNTNLAADRAISVSAHEQLEAATDPFANPTAHDYAWIDASGNEMADKCFGLFGTVNADGSNVIWNGDHYIVQEQWDNALIPVPPSTSKCVLSV